ncbi:hypothetical protein LJC07_04230 [Christensenellaceae bacterium OttesenSCG-928-L17]|nr:hypothetical protein [Christensenellaceae bacterium OttesenSCG-928-L17]
MEILKLVLLFAVIVLALKLKAPLFLAIIAATVATGLFFQMPIGTFFGTLGRSAISWSTLSVLLLFYCVINKYGTEYPVYL